MTKFAVGLFAQRAFSIKAGYSDSNLAPHSSNNFTPSQLSN
jgi:hypothetical protein